MKTVVLMSGGLDSSVLLYECARSNDVVALSLDYGQRHRRELLAAEAICARRGVPYQELRLYPDSLFAANSLTSAAIAVPHGHYADAAMQATVVPHRNALLVACAAACAAAHGCDSLAIAAHAGDSAVYPDCRPAFFAACADLLAVSDPAHPLTLLAPFVNTTKAGIVMVGAQLGVPFELTWTCYEGGAVHCGRCGACVERREAFALAGVEDPTTYA